MVKVVQQVRTAKFIVVWVQIPPPLEGVVELVDTSNCKFDDSEVYDFNLLT
ncbi:hypothetical protein [Aureibacter tunicatorum]|uniref:hypothetical protein n=1 Tax=Aureibacter tunicatorum TaxID=866807 RepID=UPI00286CFDF5|nr:hypothetical protein [Aureibacter tunicatorum]